RGHVDPRRRHAAGVARAVRADGELLQARLARRVERPGRPRQGRVADVGRWFLVHRARPHVGAGVHRGDRHRDVPAVPLRGRQRRSHDRRRRGAAAHRARLPVAAKNLALPGALLTSRVHRVRRCVLRRVHLRVLEHQQLRHPRARTRLAVLPDPVHHPRHPQATRARVAAPHAVAHAHPPRDGEDGVEHRLTEGITVRVGTARDAAAAARLHATTITEGFLPKLGVAFLTRLYARIVRDPRSFLLVVDGADGLAGMIAGTEDVGALYRAFARRDGWRAAIVAAPRLVRHAPSVVETWRYGGGGHGGSRDEADLPPAEWVAVSVAPRARGQGVGRALGRALDDEFDQ